ncbi:hypothetical protein AMELA_G00059060, partial [Ameiurus melas]
LEPSIYVRELSRASGKERKKERKKKKKKQKTNKKKTTHQESLFLKDVPGSCSRRRRTFPEKLLLLLFLMNTLIGWNFLKVRGFGGFFFFFWFWFYAHVFLQKSSIFVCGLFLKMDGLFYNEALDGVLNQHHHHHHHPPHHHQHHHGEAGGGTGYGALTRNMTLNLADAHDALTLTSPDLNLLKLTSPELERLIIQSCNGSAPTTPASGPARAFPAPKAAADEHDAFAALAEFQCHQRMSGNPDDVGPVAPGSSHACAGFAEH